MGEKRQRCEGCNASHDKTLSATCRMTAGPHESQPGEQTEKGQPKGALGDFWRGRPTIWAPAMK